MTRIPPGEIERLKQEIPVQQLAEARGIKLQSHGKDLVGLCPFHDDREPSLIITPSRNLWNCLGACGTGGTVIDWVMKAEGVNFRQAVEILKEIPGSGFQIPGTEPRKVFPPPVDYNTEEKELLTQVIEYYHQTLKKSPEALSYLEKRGLNNSEMIDRFKIGYANRTLGNQLPEKNRKDGAAIRERLTNIGIFRESGHELFNGAVVFPIFDECGQVIGIYGRKILDNLREGTAYHLYLPGPHKGIFNLEALKNSKEIILCEAIIDALTFWNAGFHNVTASYGVNGFTPDHLEALKKYGVERIFIAYDRDEAGDKAAEKLSRDLISEGFECFRILFPRNMDANEYALKLKPPEKSLEVVLQNAEWLGRSGSSSKAASLQGLGKGKRESPSTLLMASMIVPELQEGEPKAATKGKNIEEPQSLEVLSQPSEQPEVVFPSTCSGSHPERVLDAKKQTAESPKPEPAQNAPVSKLAVEVKDEEIITLLEDRRWRIRGLAKNTNREQLKVNIKISKDDLYFLDTFDLCSACARAKFLKQAAEDLKIKEDVMKSDLGKVLPKLEELRDQQIKGDLEPEEKEIILPDDERKEAMELLQDPNLLGRVLSDFEKCGVVGEEINKLVGYLAAVTRKMDKPLAIIIQSSSAAGKTALMEAILAFMPEEERMKFSAMTGQSLFYMEGTCLKHKILAIVEEEGAERASYAIKLLQSEGELTIASTGKDPKTGKHATHNYHVEGPVMIFVTTTNVDIDEELQNRCIMLSVNESREQTRAIHKLQRQMETLEGLLSLRERDRIYKLHRNAQRLLKPVLIINPYAKHLTYLDDNTQTRRGQKKYLTVIRSIAFLHQFQRPLKTGNEGGKTFQYLEVTLDDVETANRLADETLGNSLNEMSPQTRRLLFLIEKMVMEACQRLNIEKSEYHFSQREVREYSCFGNTQVKTHLRRLEELEYLIAYRSGKGQTFVYELAYDGQGKDGKPFLLGLINVAKLREKYGYDANRSGFLGDRSGESANRSAPGRGEVMHLSGGGRDEKNPEDKEPESISQENEKIPLKNTYTAGDGKIASYSHLHHTPIFPPPSPRDVM